MADFAIGRADDGNEKGKVEEEEEEGMFANLFICEQYVTKQFSFWGKKQSLLCSNMSTTDHDLTGQIVWPASKNLSWFIAKNGQELFTDKTVIEVRNKVYDETICASFPLSLVFEVLLILHWLLHISALV